MERLIRPARNILGSLRLPGDKSISHRYAMLGAFAEGTSRFTNFSTGADCASTLACMSALGANVERKEDGVIEVTGVGGEHAVTMADGFVAGKAQAAVDVARRANETFFECCMQAGSVMRASI